jgi:hypothetical protein
MAPLCANRYGPDEKGGTPLSSTGRPGVALLTAAKMLWDRILGAIPAARLAAPPNGRPERLECLL